jgi:hypothetical protein
MLATLRPRKRLFRAAALGAVTVFGASAYLMLPHGQSSIQPAPQPDAQMGLSAQTDLAKQYPLGPGVGPSSDLEGALSALSFAAIMPKDSLASSSSVSTVWSRPEGPVAALAIEFSSGVWMFERPAEKTEYPTDEFYTSLASGMRSASITQIDGTPAMLIESMPDTGNPASADTIVNGLRISVIGNGFEASELARIIATLGGRRAATAPPEGRDRSLHVPTR